MAAAVRNPLTPSARAQREGSQEAPSLSAAPNPSPAQEASGTWLSVGKQLELFGEELNAMRAALAAFVQALKREFSQQKQELSSLQEAVTANISAFKREVADIRRDFGPRSYSSCAEKSRLHRIPVVSGSASLSSRAADENL
eukprot:RCo011746